MADMLSTLANTQIPTILVVTGIAFLFIALGGRLGAQVVTDKIHPGRALVAAVAFLIAGVALSVQKDHKEPPNPDPAHATAGDRVFDNPMLGDLPLDVCLTFANDCDEPAASAWCRRQGYSAAKSFNTRRVRSTRVLGDGRVCVEGPNQPCAAFVLITCSGS